MQIELARPHLNQAKVIQESKRFNVLNCGRRWGKSALATNLLCEYALDGHPVAYFAPTYKLMEGTYKGVYEAIKGVVANKHQNQFIELITGGSIEFWSLDNPNAGRSRKYKLVIIDEAAFSKDLWGRWTEAIRPTLTDFKGGAWFMSTPKGKNDFYKFFMRGQNGEENWQSWTMSTYTNPCIDPDEIDDARRDLPEAAFSQEYLARFNDDATNPFGLTFIQQCIYPMSTEPAVVYGIDLAKSFDWSVIIGLDKYGNVCHFDRFQKDWKQTIAHILALPKGEIIMDSTGVGDAIFEEVARLRQVEGFRFTSLSKQQIMEGLATKIQQRQVQFPDGIIVNELESFTYNYTAMGVKYTAPSGLHDDCVCALALAVHKHRNVRTGRYRAIGGRQGD